jgi:hypothetical protein
VDWQVNNDNFHFKGARSGFRPFGRSEYQGRQAGKLSRSFLLSHFGKENIVPPGKGFFKAKNLKTKKVPPFPWKPLLREA